MLTDILERGTGAIRKNYGLFSDGILVKTAPKTLQEKIVKTKYDRLLGQNNPLKKDTMVTGLSAIKLDHFDLTTGQSSGLLEEGLAVGAVVATGLVAFKATQGGVSLLTGGTG